MRKSGKVTKFLIGLIVLCLLLYLGFWAAYYFSMQRVNARAKVTKCLEGQNLSFEGIVTRIDRYEYSNFMNKNYFGLTIKTADTTNRYIDWQFLIEESRVILNVVTVGQKVQKIKGDKFFYLYVIGGQRKVFKVPYCD
jgi:hypothetical protein